MIALQQQINPHFLYNTLEILRGRASANGDANLADAVAGLGRLYRGMVKTESVITLSMELDLLRSYLDIMEFRYEDTFCYQIQVEPALLNLATVKFWMQPIAENFFLHGFDPTSAFNLLMVVGREEGGAYIIDIINNGAPLSAQALGELNEALTAGETGQSGSIGLRNVAARLRYFYGERCTMQVLSSDLAGVTIRVAIQKGGTDAYAIDRR